MRAALCAALVWYGAEYQQCRGTTAERVQCLDRLTQAWSQRVEDAYSLRGGCGSTDGNGCSTGESKGKLFGSAKFIPPMESQK